MKAVLTATALLGALATGGLPVLALNLTADETATGTAAPGATGTDGQRSEPPGLAAGRDQADGRDARERAEDVTPEGDRPGGEPGWARRTDAPPGWVKNHDGQRPYGWAVREWARCMADAAAQRQGQRPHPRTTCGDKPAKPAKAGKAAKPGKPDKSAKPKDAGKPASPKDGRSRAR